MPNIKIRGLVVLTWRLRIYKGTHVIQNAGFPIIFHIYLLNKEWKKMDVATRYKH